MWGSLRLTSAMFTRASGRTMRVRLLRAKHSTSFPSLSSLLKLCLCHWVLTVVSSKRSNQGVQKGDTRLEVERTKSASFTDGPGYNTNQDGCVGGVREDWSDCTWSTGWPIVPSKRKPWQGWCQVLWKETHWLEEDTEKCHVWTKAA